ncbi:hypothetical protein BpHYR1_018864 [Brachionus plicatilis]|uniref:Uncharacterized protein n=1 Tax=Brachionus plicatilis TaxID=10195 RepID=A0A3M7PLP4_BRAPC|nr:hypothetical protein BpHYR1_018864 [Brachionus plicatilis]
MNAFETRSKIKHNGMVFDCTNFFHQASTILLEINKIQNKIFSNYHWAKVCESLTEKNSTKNDQQPEPHLSIPALFRLFPLSL